MTGMERYVRIPQLSDISLAVELYYSRIDLSNDDIKKLFGGIGGSKITALKKLADARRREVGMASWNPRRVNTVCAFEAWGLDIEDLERRLKALRRFEKKGA